MWRICNGKNSMKQTDVQGKKGIYFLFHVLFFFAHSCIIFVSPFPDDQPHKGMKTVMNQWTSQLTKWWTNTWDGDVSYLTTDQFKVNSVKTVGNGERCEMYSTTCMVKWSNYKKCTKMCVWYDQQLTVVNLSFRWRCKLLDNRPMNSVKRFSNGERCKMEITTCMVRWSNYQDGCVIWPTGDSGETKINL